MNSQRIRKEYEPAVARLVESTGYLTGGRRVPLDERKMERMRRIAEEYGNPEKNFKSVHVTGTKGKGSTAAMIAASLSANGFKTGLYTSPHISRIEERIQIDGIPIPRKRFEKIVKSIMPVLEGDDPVTFFEAVTLAAFIYFSEENADWGVFEAGIGGRFSATNILEPDCSVITSIGRDHLEIIGPGLSNAAREKCGIARNTKPLIAPLMSRGIMAAIKDEAGKIGAILHVVQKPIPQKHAMAGTHQRWNAACAIEAIDALSRNFEINVDYEKAEQAVISAALPCRFEVFGTRPPIILDGAHTPESAKALVETYLSRFGKKKYVLVFASKESKDVKDILKILLPGASRAVFTKCDSPGFASPATLANEARGKVRVYTSSKPRRALDKAEEISGGSPILVAGSFYLAGEIRAALLKKR